VRSVITPDRGLAHGKVRPSRCSERFDQRFAVVTSALILRCGNERCDHVQIARQRAEEFDASDFQQLGLLLHREIDRALTSR